MCALVFPECLLNAGMRTQAHNDGKFRHETWNDFMHNRVSTLS